MIRHMNREGENAHRDLVRSGLGGGLTADQSLPCLVTLVNDFNGVLLSLGFTVERENVLPDTESAGVPPLRSKSTRGLTSGFPSGIL